jgi:hypothetical protein
VFCAASCVAREGGNPGASSLRRTSFEHHLKVRLPCSLSQSPAAPLQGGKGQPSFVGDAATGLGPRAPVREHSIEGGGRGGLWGVVGKCSLALHAENSRLHPGPTYVPGACVCVRYNRLYYRLRRIGLQCQRPWIWRTTVPVFTWSSLERPEASSLLMPPRNQVWHHPTSPLLQQFLYCDSLDPAYGPSFGPTRTKRQFSERMHRRMSWSTLSLCSSGVRLLRSIAPSRDHPQPSRRSVARPGHLPRPVHVSPAASLRTSSFTRPTSPDA